METLQVQSGRGGLFLQTMGRSFEENWRSFWDRGSLLLSVSEVALLHQLPCVCVHVWICDSSSSLVQVYGTGAMLLHTKCHFYWERTLNRISKYSRSLTPLFGNGAGAYGIGKISMVLTKIGKISIVFVYEVSIARLIPIVNLTLFLDM